MFDLEIQRLQISKVIQGIKSFNPTTLEEEDKLRSN